MLNPRIEQRHISQINVGDVIVEDGRHVTLCKRDIKRDPFMGKSIRGNCYRLGTKLVEVVIYEHAKPAI